ncbi:FHA domain-containing protein [Nitrosospira sp. NpAV]|uniref:FHA domain-containing protein n=1 Tax=Nitrosospira sp. NpAV TaxID=58133 RepID=UPI000698C001|nr:FHA domain-containing protein [Nitrosospira sp. NpAV]
MNPLSETKFHSSAIDDRVCKYHTSNSLSAGLLGLAMAAIFLSMGGAVHASEFQVFSVKEDPAGTVIATTGIFTGTTPSAPAFELRFDDKPAIQASEVKPAPSVALETSMILCVDQSGSMGAAGIKQIQEALRGALAKSESKLNLALWAFDTEVRKLHTFSKDTAQVARGVSEIGVRSSRDSKTKLYEAIELGLSELRSRDEKGLKRLIVITDGKDDGSSITDQVVTSKANAQNISIDAIGFGKVADKDSELLARLTKNTGGHFVLARNAQELSRELFKLFNLPPPRMFDVSFRYDISGDGRKVNSAQLQFTPTGKAPILQTIEYGLSAPRVAAPSGKASEDNVDPRVLIGVLVAIAALAGAYLLSRKPAKPSPPPLSPPVPPSPLPRTQSESVVPKRAQTSVGYSFPEPAKGHPAAFLLCLSGAARGHQYPIDETIYRIGASNSNELQLSDDYVSQKHASIKYESGGLYLNDSASRNGTFLNDSRLHEAAMVLNLGDEIRIGKTTLQLVAATASQGHSAQMPDGEPFVP